MEWDWKALLGFETPPAETRLVVAMSGGVDSSVVAALLAQAGYDVVGITLQLYDQGKVAQRKGSCCAGQDIYDARLVAERMGFPHYVLDYESRFNEAVIEDFADAYLRGETPLPCVRCNQQVKFKDLLQTARELGGKALVTGHYVQRLFHQQAELHQAFDATRDQSYFLFATTQEQLDFLRFPLGGLSKQETRSLAQNLGLTVAEKPDSQDICFVPNGSYAKIVQQLRPGSLEEGDIVDVNGHVLGRHQGTIHYTIGQRKGIGVGGQEEPLFVLKIDPSKHQVVVGPKAFLACQEIHLKEVNWLSNKDDDPEILEEPLNVQVKIRSTRPAAPARLFLRENQTAEVLLDEPEYGVAAGQACVFYQGTRVLGGGWIISKSAEEDGRNV
ncbi:MAG: tRNA 2-thiouridine(34) synthase MnmA [Alphaproteobacteria bacterium]